MTGTMTEGLDNAPGVLLKRGDAGERIVADLLTTVEREGRVSQRQLAAQLGVALGLVNSYVKRCVKKGLIKVRNVPSRRYMYYLTPQGFSEKARLTAEYLAWSFASFREARAECSALMDEVIARGWRSVTLVGASDIAEIAILCASEMGIRVDSVVDPGVTKANIIGVPVAATLEAAAMSSDGFIITGIRDAQALYDGVAAAKGPQRVLVPPMLSVGLAQRRVSGK
jgi:DNA-binding MarR family transcriptional regulator